MAQEMVYKFRPGSRIKGSAREIGEALEEVRVKFGGLTAGNTVEAARPRTAPLHGYFTWDNRKAAEKCREEEARHLIAAIEVRIRDEDGKISVPVRAFVAVGVQEDRYLPVMQVLATPDMRRKLLAQAYDELRAFQRKYANLGELAQLFEVVNKLVA